MKHELVEGLFCELGKRYVRMEIRAEEKQNTQRERERESFNGGRR